MDKIDGLKDFLMNSIEHYTDQEAIEEITANIPELTPETIKRLVTDWISNKGNYRIACEMLETDINDFLIHYGIKDNNFSCLLTDLEDYTRVTQKPDCLIMKS